MNQPTNKGVLLSDTQIAEIRERDLRHRDSRTLMKDVAEGGRDRRSLLSHIAALQQRNEELREALKLARPYVEIVFARNPQQQLPGIALAAIDAALSKSTQEPTR